MKESDLYRELLTIEDQLHLDSATKPRSITNYVNLVRDEEWLQAWDPEARELGQMHSISGSIWSDAIERCLEENGAAFIPRFDTPIYIDRPIELRGGNRLIVHPETEIRLKVGEIGTCMVRSSHIVPGHDHPVQMCEGADENILIGGGIWSDQNNEGHGRGGQYDQKGSMPDAMGTFLLHNVSRVVVRNMVFLDCSAFAIQIGNASDFVIENLTFDEVADGVHVEGPAARGVIRHLAGKTTDDFVAINAWDWDMSSMTFGPITDMLVEDLEMLPGYTWSELRMLPGTKLFSSGETLECGIRRCIFRDVRGIHTFKLYDQPNVAKPEEDSSHPIGKMTDIFFSNIQVDGVKRSEYYDTSSDAVFDICVDIDTISIRDVRLNYIPGEDDMIPYLVSVGPKSLVWHKAPTDDESDSCWRPAVEDTAEDELIEVYNASANPVVQTLTIAEVYTPAPDRPGTYVPCTDIAALINERGLTPDPESPNSAARGHIVTIDI